jgi:hypothetical protein
MQILITPSDIIKRCLFLEYKRFILKDMKEDEIKNIVLEDKPIILKEDDAYVIGLLKIVETPNLIHRFKEHIEEVLKIRSNIVDNKLYIKVNDILREIINFKNCFPDYFITSFEYKKGIDELKNFIDKLYPEVEKSTITKIPNKDGKIIEYYLSNVVKNLLYPKKEKNIND